MKPILWTRPRSSRRYGETFQTAARSIFGAVWFVWGFDPRALWIGAYVKDPAKGNPLMEWKYRADVYVCVVPMFPLVFKWRHGGLSWIRANFREWWRAGA